MKKQIRPMQASLFSMLFLLAGIVMIWLGIDAHAYYVPAVSLALAGALLWRGRGARWFKYLLAFNQLSGIVLILDLWLGDMLHLPKLTISAAMLAANLLLGGPLMSVLAMIVFASMRFSPALPAWFLSKEAA